MITSAKHLEGFKITIHPAGLYNVYTLIPHVESSFEPSFYALGQTKMDPSCFALVIILKFWP